MANYRYATAEWLEASEKNYHSTDYFEEKLKKITTKIFFRITAEPAWGIDSDIIFGAIYDAGKLVKLSFVPESEAKKEAEFILVAPPQEWKLLLTKENKFITDFMLNKVTLEQGSKVGILKIAPRADVLVESLTQFELQYQDDMSPEELDEYRAYFTEFRKKLGD
jgi:putative sterol carrier protein